MFEEKTSWSDKYRVGVDEFDDQHKKIFELIDQLFGDLEDEITFEATEKVVNELLNYTVFHFQNEEQAMKMYDYPDYEKHKAEHEKLIVEVKDMESRLKAKRPILKKELSAFLVDWLQKHIGEADKKYAPHFKAQGIS